MTRVFYVRELTTAGVTAEHEADVSPDLPAGVGARAGEGHRPAGSVLSSGVDSAVPLVMSGPEDVLRQPGVLVVLLVVATTHLVHWEPPVLGLFPEENGSHYELPCCPSWQPAVLEVELEASLAVGDVPVLVERSLLALAGHLPHLHTALSGSTDLRPQGQTGLLDVSGLQEIRPELLAKSPHYWDGLGIRKIRPDHVFRLPRLALAQETIDPVNVLWRDIFADVQGWLLLRE